MPWNSSAEKNGAEPPKRRKILRNLSSHEKPKEREAQNAEKYCVANALNRATCSPVGAFPVGTSKFLGPSGLYPTQQIISLLRTSSSFDAWRGGGKQYFNSWSPCDRALDLQDHASYFINDTRLSLMVGCRSLFLCCRGRGFRGPATEGSLRRGFRGCLAARVSFATGDDS